MQNMSWIRDHSSLVSYAKSKPRYYSKLRIKINFVIMHWLMTDTCTHKAVHLYGALHTLPCYELLVSVDSWAWSTNAFNVFVIETTTLDMHTQWYYFLVNSYYYSSGLWEQYEQLFAWLFCALYIILVEIDFKNIYIYLIFMFYSYMQHSAPTLTKFIFFKTPY